MPRKGSLSKHIDYLLSGEMATLAALEKASLYDAKMKGRVRPRAEMKGAHVGITKKCSTCYVDHLPSVHKSHGIGSYEGTHTDKSIAKAKRTAKAKRKAAE